MLKMENVWFKYESNEILRDINIEIKEGTSVALIGPNGSGKTTFLKLINGLVFPTKGRYCFYGEEISEKKISDAKFSKNFHKKIGFVFQNAEAQLFCSNVYEEIAFGPRQMGIEESEVDRRVKDCLSLLGIEDLKNRIPYHLSGGEKKKVAIASVLSLNPEVLVLDEPMNDLDPRSKRFLRNLLFNLHKGGKTIICSTHDFEYVKDIFEKCIVFSEEKSIIRYDEYKKVINDHVFLEKNNII